VGAGPEPASDGQLAFWRKALGNPSEAVRKQAALRLKSLTGIDYEY